MKPKVVVLFALGISSLVSCKTEKEEGRNDIPPGFPVREVAVESSPAAIPPLSEELRADEEANAVTEGEAESESPLAGVAEAPRAIPVGEDAELGDELAFEVALEESPPVEVIAPEILESKDFNVFYVELSRFGAWFLTDDFGYVWQPGVAVTEKDWRPYTRGRWVDSEEGWVWVSDEPFGWATYHYGRWALLENHGWVWIPGEDWAPAWVSWRKSDDHIGWAPLPPETSYADDFYYDSGVDVAYGVDPSWYNFVPVTSFHQPVIQHCVPRSRVVTIWGGSINITVIRSERGRIHCHGPDRDWVHRRTGRRPEVCRLSRHDRPVHFDDHRRERLRGHDYEVFAPQVGARWNPAVRPPVVRDQWGRTQVNRGGRKMSDEAARRFATDYTRRQKDARDVVKTGEAREAWERQRRVHERISAERERQQAEERARVAKGRLIETDRQREAERESRQTEERARVVRGRKMEPERPRQETERQREMEEGRREAEQRAAVEQRAAAERERAQAEERARVVRGRKVESERQEREMEEKRREAEQRVAAERERAQAEERARVVRGRKVESERQEREMEEKRREAEQRVAAERERAQAEERARVVRGRKVESERQEREMEEKRREAEQRVAAERERAQAEERARVVRGQKVESERQEREMEEKRREAEQRVAAERERAQAEERARVVRGRKVESERQEREMEEKRREAEQRAASERERQQAEARSRAMKEQQIAAERQRRAVEEQRRAAAQRASAERDRQQAEARARAMEDQRRAAERQQAEERARVVRGRQIEAQRRDQQLQEQRREGERRAASERERQQEEKRSRVVRGRRVE